MKNIISVLLIAGLLTGCISSTVDYKKPQMQSINNTKFIKSDFDKAWDILVRNLSSDFFVINNIDKSSRLINVSFSTNTPSSFVDCGMTSRTFSNARGTQNYNYQTSDSINYSIAVGINAFNIQKVSKLDGVLNIYIAPESQGSVVTVNGKYVLNNEFKGVSFDGQQRDSLSKSFSFSTKSPYSEQDITCVSNGKLEKKILDMVN